VLTTRPSYPDVVDLWMLLLVSPVFVSSLHERLAAHINTVSSIVSKSHPRAHLIPDQRIDQDCRWRASDGKLKEVVGSNHLQVAHGPGRTAGTLPEEERLDFT